MVLKNNKKYLRLHKSSDDLWHILCNLFNQILIRDKYILTNIKLLIIIADGFLNRLIKLSSFKRTEGNRLLVTFANMMLVCNEQQFTKLFFQTELINCKLAAVIYSIIANYSDMIEDYLPLRIFNKTYYNLCNLYYDSIINALHIHGADKFNKLPIHFAALTPTKVCTKGPKCNDHALKTCGNTKCKKAYLTHKYGINLQLLPTMPQESWKNLKVLNKWYICGGCKLVYYCSRKCQKISWNKQNHAYQCKIIQKYQN